MKDLKEMKKRQTEEKKKNKGFSLVELIIVIAIMAILVGVVGTQVLPYIERSRESKDYQVISSYCTAAVSAFATNAATVNGASRTIVMGTTPSGGDADLIPVYNEIVNLTGFTTIPNFQNRMESNAGQGITAITITTDANSRVTVTVTETGTTAFAAVREQ